MLDPVEEKKTIEDKMYDAFEPKMISTSKNYKYFFRGQYVVTAEPEDVRVPTQRRKKKLQAFE